MFNSSEMVTLIHRVKQANLTYLNFEKLVHLVSSCAYIEQNNIPGSIIEAGCALGGSTICIASAKAISRPLYVYDVFGMIPPPSDDDGDDVHKRYEIIAKGESQGINGDLYYGYNEDLYTTVVNNLKFFSITAQSHHVTLIKGLLQDTMVLDEPVALAHVDVDWYEPVKTCLERIFPRLSPGGLIILDDYYAWSGCRKAVDEFMLQHSREAQFLPEPTATVIKNSKSL